MGSAILCADPGRTKAHESQKNQNQMKLRPSGLKNDLENIGFGAVHRADSNSREIGPVARGVC